MLEKVRIASRTSKLAMTQTNYIISRLREVSPDTDFEVVPIVTKGDKILDVTLSKVGGKGLFVSEVEATLLDGQADIAVHSLKDVPAELANGLQLSAYPVRADARDVLISRSGQRLAQLPRGAKVGTSSLRRVAQLLSVRPDLDVQSVRGNIDTRLRKLSEGEYDAIVLAAAGLVRMGWEDRITEYLSPSVCLPAVGQGILGIESRASDSEVNALLEHLNDADTAAAAHAERTLLFALNGSCQVPIGGYAVVDANGTRMTLRGLVGSPDGKTVLKAEATGSSPRELGLEVSQKLRELGADVLLSGLSQDGGV